MAQARRELQTMKDKVRELLRETLEGVLERTPRTSLEKAAQAPNGIEALIAALTELPAGDAGPADELAAARLRGVRARNRLLEARGGTIGSSEAGKLLGITRQAVHQRRKAGKLLGLETGHHAVAYPVWQFGERGLIPGLEETLKALDDASPWSKARFLLSRNVRLDDEAPIDTLERGRKAEVIEAAAAHGAHGAA